MFDLITPSNFIMSCDGYKVSHKRQMPKKHKTKNLYVVVVPRKPSKYSDKIVACGQSLVAKILANTRITMKMIDQAERLITRQGYLFDRPAWELIVKRHGGRLPLTVVGVEEGRVVDPQTPIIGIFSTDEDCAWLTTYVESWVQEIIWKMSTVASLCRSVKIKLKEKIILTGADLSQLDSKLINFGDRGADSPTEAPVMAGISHAVFFNASDCIRANMYIEQIYSNSYDTYTKSIHASEHSVMVQNSDVKNKDDFGAALMAMEELEAIVESSKTNSYLIPAFSVVIDTYNSRRFVADYFGVRLKDRLQAVAELGGLMVFRPDSGDVTVEPGLVGKDIIDHFGFSINSKGYVDLPNYTAVLQGDGNRIDTYESIIDGWIQAGFSMNNFSLGMGSGITHDNARDDFSFSMKAIAQLTDQDSEWQPLLKDPNTDHSKRSLSGIVNCFEYEDTIYVLENNSDFTAAMTDKAGWRTWYKNGYQEFQQTFESVRAFANQGI